MKKILYTLPIVIIIAIIAIQLCLVGNVKAQVTNNMYVTQSGSGNMSGSDWNNACAGFTGSCASYLTYTGTTTLLRTLNRGATYWLAAGNYGDLTIGGTSRDANDTRLITIKKSSIDRGQAVFSSIKIIESGYITIDGTYEYGIKVSFPKDKTGIDITATTTQLKGIYYSPKLTYPNISIKYVDVAGPGGTTPYPYSINVPTWGIYNHAGNINNFLLSHSDVHGANILTVLDYSPGLIVEYTKFHDSLSSSGGPYTYAHPLVFTSYNYALDSTTRIFRYNEIYNFDTVGFYADTSGNWNVYGNLFHDSVGPYATGFIANNYGQNYSGTIKLYNNTFANLNGQGINVSKIPSISTANNLIYKTTVPYGIYGTNNLTISSPSPFVSSTDYHLSQTSAAINAGTALSIAGDYNIGIDKEGHARGADGSWDIGAYESVVIKSPDTTRPSTIANLKATNVKNSSVSISWDPSTDPVVQGQITSGIAGYSVYRNDVYKANLPASTTSYTDSSVAANSHYTYSVMASDQAGNIGLQSNLAVDTTGDPIPTVSLASSATSVTAGSNINLNWNSTNATNCNLSITSAIKGDLSGYAGPINTYGSVAINGIDSNSTFTVSCTNSTGNKASGSVTVSIAAPQITAQLSANPMSVAQGKTTVLTWSSTNADHCMGTINGDNTSSWGTTKSGSAKVAPVSTTTYTFTCYGRNGSKTTPGSASVYVTYVLPSELTASISADEIGVNGSNQYKVTWSSLNADSCALSTNEVEKGGAWSGYNGPVNTSGSIQGEIIGDTTFNISCTGGGHTIKKSKSVQYIDPTPSTDSGDATGYVQDSFRANVLDSIARFIKYFFK